MDYELIADYRCHTGENPLWHPKEKKLYWVDIPSGRLFAYCPKTRRHEQCREGTALGGFTIEADGSLLLFLARGAVARRYNGTEEFIIESLPEEHDSRFNDVIADPVGRVFCGTMPTPQRPGRLYRLDTDGTIDCVLEGVGCANGMGFTPNRRHMYFTDSGERRIDLFDYDAATGELLGRRPFWSPGEAEGTPDGLTVDAEGCVWSALWGGCRAVRLNEAGEIVAEVAVPAKQVSSVTFGGEHYTDLYITTAGGQDRGALGDGAGALFRVQPPVGGVPEFSSRITCG